MRQAIMISILAILLIGAVSVTFAREGELAGDPLRGTGPSETTISRLTEPESNLSDTTTSTETAPAGESRNGATIRDRKPRDNDKKDKERRGSENAENTQGDALNVDAADGRDRKENNGERRGKVTVCHKGKKTLTVGAPAEEAHARHGDTPGAC